MVIYSAGTSKGAISGKAALSETQARELSETPLREIEVSAHTDTNTALLLAQIADLKRELERANVEKDLLKAQAVDGLHLPPLSTIN